MRRASFAIIALGLLLALAPKDARAASGTPTFSSIPEAHVPDMLHPRDAPEGVPAGETLEGMNVQTQSFGGGHASLLVSGAAGRCVTIGAPPPGLAPSGNASASIRVSSGAMPLRVEWLVADSKGQTNLEIVDAWVDVKTTAIRKVTTTRLPLTTMKVGPAGYSVYGFRDAGILHVVLPTQERLAYVDARGHLSFSACGHVRLTLDTSSAGAMVFGAGILQLPKKHGKVAALNPADVADSVAVPQAARGPDGFVAEHTRGFQVSVSTSRTKRDREPQISVTVGYAEEPEGITPSTNGMGAGFEGRMPEPEIFD